MEVVQLAGETFEVTDAVGSAVAEGLDVQLAEDRVLVPEWIGGRHALRPLITWPRGARGLG